MYCTDDTYMLAPVIAEHLPAGIHACLRLVACEYWRGTGRGGMCHKNSDAHRVDVGIGCARLLVGTGLSRFLLWHSLVCDSAQYV